MELTSIFEVVRIKKVFELSFLIVLRIKDQEKRETYQTFEPLSIPERNYSSPPKIVMSKKREKTLEFNFFLNVILEVCNHKFILYLSRDLN
jgi:hypothetical protein